MLTTIEKLAKAAAQSEKQAFLAWGGGQVGLHPKGRGIGGSVGYTNLLGTLPIPTAGIDIGGPRHGFMAGVTPDSDSDFGISPYIGARIGHPRKSGVTRQFPRGLPDILYDKLRGRTRDEAFELSYPDKAEPKKESKPEKSKPEESKPEESKSESSDEPKSEVEEAAKAAADYAWRQQVEMNKSAKGRCWSGYEPVPGKKPYSDDSCRPVGSKKKKKKKETAS